MNDGSKPHIVARWETPGTGDDGPPARRTEARLVEGTLACLRLHGLGGTTSRAIAATAGVNLGAITYHFGSKDELVAQALLRAIRDWVEPALEILRRDMDPAARLLAAVDALRNAFDSTREMVPVYLEALMAAHRSDTLRRGVEELMREVRGFLAAQLTELRESGYVPRWVDPEATATLLVATADGLALHGVIEPGAVDTERIGAQAVQLLLAARNTESREGPPG